jgi:hypothetical protein
MTYFVDTSQLEELYQLCPSLTDLNIDVNSIDKKYSETLSKFKKLKLLVLHSEENSQDIMKFMMNYFEIIEGTLESIVFKTESVDISEFYEVLFEKTDLTKFYDFGSLKTEKESKIISNWLKTKSKVNSMELDGKLK